jgi:hypothetical protein
MPLIHGVKKISVMARATEVPSRGELVPNTFVGTQMLMVAARVVMRIEENIAKNGRSFKYVA